MKATHTLFFKLILLSFFSGLDQGYAESPSLSEHRYRTKKSLHFKNRGYGFLAKNEHITKRKFLKTGPTGDTEILLEEISNKKDIVISQSTANGKPASAALMRQYQWENLMQGFLEHKLAIYSYDRHKETQVFYNKRIKKILEEGGFADHYLAENLAEYFLHLGPERLQKMQEQDMESRDAFSLLTPDLHEHVQVVVEENDHLTVDKKTLSTTKYTLTCQGELASPFKNKKKTFSFTSTLWFSTEDLCVKYVVDSTIFDEGNQFHFIYHAENTLLESPPLSKKKASSISTLMGHLLEAEQGILEENREKIRLVADRLNAWKGEVNQLDSSLAVYIYWLQSHLVWERGLTEVRARAQKENKKILLYIEQPLCIACFLGEKNLYTQHQFKEIMQKAREKILFVKANAHECVAHLSDLGIPALNATPYFALLGPDGKMEKHVATHQVIKTLQKEINPTTDD